ncbi:MAG: peroxiredoxin [Conexivisphaerales archaeon]
MTLKVGDKAPQFSAQADDGSQVDLLGALKEGNIVLYFYPKDETMGCTAEACSFRDNWSEVRAEKAVVIGVSSDSVESHASFKKHHDLPFRLMSDPDKRIRESYGVRGRLMPPRVTFVIDQSGVIRHVYDSNLAPTHHVREALAALRRINEGIKSDTHPLGNTSPD